MNIDAALTIGIFIGNGVFALVLLCVFFLVGWLVSLGFRRMDVADVWWPLGFVVVAWSSIGISLLSYPTLTDIVSSGIAHQLVLFVFVHIWALRLAWHIVLRIMRHGEDARYAELRKKWGKHTPWQSLVKVFALQMLLLLLVSMPILIAGSSRIESRAGAVMMLACGMGLWFFGFFYESIADWQLRLHKQQHPQGHGVFREGLWKYSRHPNYFGEITQWWALWLIAASPAVPLYVCIGMIGPITITFLITRFSGIPLLEKRYDGNQEYEQYRADVPALIPQFFIKKHRVGKQSESVDTAHKS